MTEPVDLRRVAVTGDGVAWSVNPAGVNVNLVVLGPHARIGEHRNDEVDVLVVVIDGDAALTVDGRERLLATSTCVLVERGTSRRIDAGQHGVRYLSVHRQRAPLAVKPRQT